MGFGIIPHHRFQTRGIDPRSFCRDRDGASHAANVISVASGEVDLATDFDRNLAAMIAAGRVRDPLLTVVWRSDPLPNDTLAVRRDLDPGLKRAIAEAALAIGEADAARLMPPGYTGWGCDILPPAERAGRRMRLDPATLDWVRSGRSAHRVPAAHQPWPEQRGKRGDDQHRQAMPREHHRGRIQVVDEAQPDAGKRGGG